MVWTHTDGRASFAGLLPLLNAAPCRLIQVLGSAAADPRRGVEDLRRDLERYRHIEYRYVALGSKEEAGGRRWLTDDEISGGVLACEATARDLIVGDLVPE